MIFTLSGIGLVALREILVAWVLHGSRYAGVSGDTYRYVTGEWFRSLHLMAAACGVCAAGCVAQYWWARK